MRQIDRNVRRTDKLADGWKAINAGRERIQKLEGEVRRLSSAIADLRARPDVKEVGEEAVWLP